MYPVVGIIFDRESHPAAQQVDDLLNSEIASRVMCDEHLPLSQALEREWPVDAHLMLYSVIDEDGDAVFARLKKKAPFAAQLLKLGGQILSSILVFDYDLPKLNGQKQVWGKESLGRFVQGLAEADLLPPSHFYTTLHGARFIYVLTKPVDHLRYEQLAHAFVADYKAKGIELDAQCTDWTRLFRLPRTVRQDSGQTFSGDECFMLLQSEQTLDPDSIKVSASLPASAADKFAEIKLYEAEQPDDEMVQSLLRVGPNGRTDWYKTARKYLQGREAYAVCFEDQPINVDAGWNNGVTKLIGGVIGMTARQEHATAEGVYALIYGGLEQLQAEERKGANATDWFSKAWNIVCRMWSSEQAQIEGELREREESIKAAKGVREDIIAKIKSVRPDDLPADPEKAEETLKQRMIASDGRQHWIMRPSADYNIRPVQDSMLIPMIREIGMEDVIETSEMRGKSWVTKSAKTILDEHATPITSVRCSSREQIAYIEGPPGYRVLHLPVHRLNPLVKPVQSKAVDEWLKKLFGEKYELGIEWLSHALHVSAPICALNLYGAPGAGKGLLAQGLAECFEGERTNDGRVMGKFNEGLLHTPVINCDEGVPQIKSDESMALDQAFRSFVSGGNITIRSMYMNPFSANVYPRIMFTSNDRDILKSIVGHRDLTDDDIRAIEIRLLSVCVTSEARALLTSRGNYAYTKGWIHGTDRSNYTLANHIRFLYDNRKPSRGGTGRLLVEGEVDTTLVRGMRLRSASAQTVLKSLVKMIESPTSAKKHGMHIEYGEVWITPSALVSFVEAPITGIGESLGLPRAGQILRQFGGLDNDEEIPKIRPPGATRGRWVNINLGLLYEESERYGMPNKNIEALLRGQKGGPSKIALIQAHLDVKE